MDGAGRNRCYDPTRSRPGPGGRARRRTAIVAVLAALIGCSTAPDDATAPIRNATVPPGITPIVSSPLLLEVGGVIGGKGLIDLSRFSVADVIAAPVDPTRISIQPSTVERLKALAARYAYLPVVVRLPVAYDAVARAQVLKKAGAATDTPRTAGVIPMGTDDAAIVAATANLSTAIATLPNWNTRSISGAQMQLASAEFNNYPAAPAPTPTSDTVNVTGAAYLSQLGQVPYVRALLTADEVLGLAEKKLIIDAWVDGYGEPTLADSTELIGSNEPTTFFGMNGAGTSVAVLDTGVLATHPAFGTRVTLQRCYSGSSNCPNGQTTDTSATSALPCRWSVACMHGTHVAGIVAGGAVPVATIASPTADKSAVSAGTTAWHAGVAPGANILAYRLASCSATKVCFYESDFVAAAGHVASIATARNIVALNYSAGSANRYSSCDPSSFSQYQAVSDAIDTLTAVNVATVVSAGNDGSTSKASFPSCLSNAVNVANTTKTDTVSGTSNIAASTDLLAPGTSIVAASVSGTTMTTPTFETQTGTSMAAPHVAGAWALIRQQVPTMNVSSVLSWLKTTGVTVADTRTGGTLSKPRIDLRNILPVATSTGTSSTKKFTGTRLSMSQGTTFSKSGPDWTGMIAFPSGGMVPTTADYAALYFTTRGGKPKAITVNGVAYDAGKIIEIGYSDAPCRARTPMRSFRVELTRGSVASSNRIGISMLDANAYVDGGSIFLVSPVTGSSSTLAGVVIAEGLGVLNNESPQMSAALPFATELTGRPVGLHLAVADGQSAAESAIVLRTTSNQNGVAFTSPNQFTASDGPNWDDLTFDLTGLGLTGAPDLVVVSHTGVSSTATRDCLAIPAAMLNIGARPMSAMLALGLVKPSASTYVIDPTRYRIPKVVFTPPSIVRS